MFFSSMKKQNAKSIKRVLKPVRKKNNDYELPRGVIFDVPAAEIRKRSDEALRAISALGLERLTFKVAAHWTNYFTVFKVSRGTKKNDNHQAILDGRLEQHFKALTANFKSQKSVLIEEALRRLERTAPEDLNEIRISLAEASSQIDVSKSKRQSHIKMGDHSLKILERIVSIVSNLKSAIGPDLHTMRYFRNGTEKAAAKAAVKNLSEAVLEYNRRESRPKAHGNAGTFPFMMEDGKEAMVPLAWLAIEFARRFAEKEVQLPTKLDVRLCLINAYPSLRSKELSTWTEIWKISGLDELDEARPFTHPRNKRMVRQ